MRTLICAVVVALSLASPPASGGDGPRVYPPDAVIEGKTLEEWTAEWWRWVASVPCGAEPCDTGCQLDDLHPLKDPTGEHCADGQSGPVFFVVGTPGGTAHRTMCVAPGGKPIFVAMLNVVTWAPGDCPPTDMEMCRALADDFMDKTIRLELMVDGKGWDELQDPEDPHELSEYRFRSSIFEIDLPEPPACSIFNLDPAIEYRYAADGYYVMLEPLPPGEHSLRYGGELGLEPDNFWVDLIYDPLVVAPAHFRRGDANGDGHLNLTDAVFILDHLFRGMRAPSCRDATDVDDSGQIDITDPIFALNYLFRAGTVPPPPGPEECGPDLTEDSLLYCSIDC